MKISLNVIKKLIDFELPEINEIVSRVNSQLGVVEEVINLGEKYAGARIVKVVECEKHPDADRLSVTRIDDGGFEDVPRDDNGLVQVVCGAPNVHAGMLAVWLPPKSIVPTSFDGDEKFVLSARKLRGVLSQGMMAAADELAIGSDHAGIIEIKPEEFPEGIQEKIIPGAKFAELVGLDDYVIDIENKMFTHRPDLFGHIGVAREISAIFGYDFKSPEWMNIFPQIPEFTDNAEDFFHNLVVRNETNGQPRPSEVYSVFGINDVEVKPSPLWLQCELVAMGSKPINNIVDITNYVMLMTAQPTHAYDYDKVISGGEKFSLGIGVRMAKDGEKAILLNGKEYTFTSEDIVIANDEKVIGLAGIMGGLDSEVSEDTKRVLVEVANFDMYILRKTAMRHGIFTDALTRFNKGQSIDQIPFIVKWTQDLFKSFGMNKASKPILGVTSDNLVYKSMKISAEFINDRLGSDFRTENIAEILNRVEFKNIKQNDGFIEFDIPFWRTDIELPEDIVEEVGRIYGFDKLSRKLPTRLSTATPENIGRKLKSELRNILSGLGANEVLNYSFIHSDVIKKAGQDISKAYSLSNALSPDLQNYRLSVLPSLMSNIYSNIRAGHGEFTIYEFGKGHNIDYGSNNENLPNEKKFFDGIYTSKFKKDGAAFYYAKEILNNILSKLNIEVEYKKFDGNLCDDLQSVVFFNEDRTAMIISDGQVVGYIGEFKPGVVKEFKLPEYTAGWTFDFDKLTEVYQKSGVKYQPLSKYPATNRDVCFKVNEKVSYGDVVNTILETSSDVGGVKIGVELLDIYQNENSFDKQITFRFNITPEDKTLNKDEISEIEEKITSTVVEKYSAEIV